MCTLRKEVLGRAGQPANWAARDSDASPEELCTTGHVLSSSRHLIAIYLKAASYSELTDSLF